MNAQQLSPDGYDDGSYRSGRDFDDEVRRTARGSVSSSSSYGSSYTSATSAMTNDEPLVKSYWEMWEYQGSNHFRGMLVEKGNTSALIVFFDQSSLGHGLKPGMMALLDFAQSSVIECDRIIVCIDRDFGQEQHGALVKDLRWVGFEPSTLSGWTYREAITSERWTFVDMEVS